MKTVMQIKPKFDRRLFLKGAGLGVGMLPLLQDNLVQAGCLPAGRKRLITLTWGNGLQRWVTGSGSSYVLPDIMQSLEPHRADLLIPQSLGLKTFEDQYPKDIFNNKAHDSCVAHLIGRLLTVTPGARFASSPSPTPSIDYLIGAKLKQTINTPFTVVNLGVMAKSPYYTWQAAAAVATPDNDPYHAFDTVFAGAKLGTDAPAIDKVRLTRKSVLDYVKKDITRFSKNLGKDDQVRIDAHLSSIREIEGQLSAAPVSTSCTLPALGTKWDVASSDNYEKTLRAQIDIGVAALAAGVTNVLTIQPTNGQGANVNLTWLGYKAGTPYGHDGCCADASSHHAAAHDNGQAKTDVDRWFFEQVAYLITKLKAEKEGTSSIFDNSVVFAPNNMGMGNTHAILGLRYLLAGTGGGYFKTGRVVPSTSASHTGVLAAICNCFGVSTDGFIDPTYGTAELPGLRA